MEQIKIFCPATVANISCGFDVLGLALNNVGDEMVFTKNNSNKLKITKITGADLSTDLKENIVGIVAEAMVEKHKIDFGIDIEIHKKIKPGSGIGSSAASAAGTAFGVNALMGNVFSKKQLIEFAMLGEAFVGGSKVADNVAPALLGGITLIKSYQPFAYFSLPVPAALFVVVVHPQIELKTQDARKILPKQVPMKNAIAQSAHLASFVHALHTNNYKLLGTSLQDFLVEPHRKILIPLFDETKQEALKNGALGGGISGAGPSQFYLCKGKETALKVEQSIATRYQKHNIPAHVFHSEVNREGIYSF
ncbi:MAG: homoserine kinase [Chitinophagales bacterium]|nr:homoserine kinase [Chitinophagales bacterium]